MSDIKERKLDVPFKVGNDYFIESKRNLPFYEVPLYLTNYPVRWRTESELSLPEFNNCVVGIFRKCSHWPCGGVFTYKLDVKESQKNYKPSVQEAME